MCNSDNRASVFFFFFFFFAFKELKIKKTEKLFWACLFVFFFLSEPGSQIVSRSKTTMF